MNGLQRKRISKTDRIYVYNLCSGHCAYCGCEISIGQMQVDHYIPFELAALVPEQDLNSTGNYLPACRSCNNYKSSMNIEKFRLCVSKYTDVLLRDSVTYRNAVRFGQVVPAKHVQQFYYEKAGVSIPAMEWDYEYRTELHKSYFLKRSSRQHDRELYASTA